MVREKVELGLLPPAPDFAKADPTKVDWRTIWTVEPIEDDEDELARSTSSQDIGRRHWF